MENRSHSIVSMLKDSITNFDFDQQNNIPISKRLLQNITDLQNEISTKQHLDLKKINDSQDPQNDFNEKFIGIDMQPSLLVKKLTINKSGESIVNQKSKNRSEVCYYSLNETSNLELDKIEQKNLQTSLSDGEEFFPKSCFKNISSYR